VSRDINDLRQLDLIKKVRGGWTVNRAVVEAFLPFRADLDMQHRGDS
jgi:DeoR/GlpR family transcriptional regulator of sugar metabolism